MKKKILFIFILLFLSVFFVLSNEKITGFILKTVITDDYKVYMNYYLKDKKGKIDYGFYEFNQELMSVKFGYNSKTLTYQQTVKDKTVNPYYGKLTSNSNNKVNLNDIVKLAVYDTNKDLFGYVNLGFLIASTIFTVPGLIGIGYGVNIGFFSEDKDKILRNSTPEERTAINNKGFYVAFGGIFLAIVGGACLFVNLLVFFPFLYYLVNYHITKNKILNHLNSFSDLSFFETKYLKINIALSLR